MAIKNVTYGPGSSRDTPSLFGGSWLPDFGQRGVSSSDFNTRIWKEQ